MNKVLEFRNKNKEGKLEYQGKFEIKNTTDDSAELYMYGYISSYKWDDSDVVPEDVREFLDDIKDVKNLHIYINSGGGSVFAGMAIYSMLKRHKAYKTVHVDGLAASMASVIAFCGDKIIIPANAYLMIHRAATIAWGNVDDLLKAIEMLETIENGAMEVYKAKLKNPENEELIKAKMYEETWFTGAEAAEYFDIEVEEEVKAVAYAGELKYKNKPKDIIKPPSNTDQLKAKLLLECAM